MRRKILTALFLLTVSSDVYAYLDPGTGSMLIYFLVGIFATLVYSSKELMYKVKIFFMKGKLDASLAKPENADILFYSEGGHYWNVFLPVIESLSKMGIPCAYYTSDENDPGINWSGSNFQAKYLGTPIQSYILMNRAEVKIVVTTTPQLDVLQLKKSKKVKHYVHLIHSPTDVLLYKKFAFDHFDSVMCSGSHQIKGLRAIEKARGYPEKKIFKTGLTYYDVMNNNYVNKTMEKLCVLVAPTWGENSMLVKFGSLPLKKLLNSGFHVIFRPHPQSFVSQAILMEEIIDELKDFENFELDRSISPEDSMQKSHALLSDISGIIFDFYFIYKKPIALIAHQVLPGGFEAEDVEDEVWEMTVSKTFTAKVDESNIEKVDEIISRIIENHEESDIESFRDKSLYNFGKAGPIAAVQLQELLTQV